MRIFSFFVYENGLVIEGRETGRKGSKNESWLLPSSARRDLNKKENKTYANDWKANSEIALFVE